MEHGPWIMHFPAHTQPRFPQAQGKRVQTIAGPAWPQATPLRPPPRFALTAMEPIGANSGQIQP